MRNIESPVIYSASDMRLGLGFGLDMGAEMLPTINTEVLDSLPGFPKWYEYCLKPQITSNKLTVVGIIGLSGSGKDTVLGQTEDLLSQDPYFQGLRRKKTGFKILVKKVNFSDCAISAQSSGIIEKSVDKDGKIVHRKYSEEEYEAISRLMESRVFRLANSAPDEDNPDHVVLFVQPSSPTILNTPQGRFGVNNRGFTVVEKLLKSGPTRKITNIIFLERDESIRSKIMEYRQEVLKATPDTLGEILDKYKIKIILHKENGKTIMSSENRFSKKVWQLLIKILPSRMAPSSSMKRSDEEHRQLLEELYNTKLISSQTTRAYYEALAKMWGIEGISYDSNVDEVRLKTAQYYHALNSDIADSISFHINEEELY